jgi:hypothetical protein
MTRDLRKCILNTVLQTFSQYRITIDSRPHLPRKKATRRREKGKVNIQ